MNFKSLFSRKDHYKYVAFSLNWVWLCKIISIKNEKHDLWRNGLYHNPFSQLKHLLYWKKCSLFYMTTFDPTYQHIFCITTMHHPLTYVVFLIRYFIGTSVSTFSFRIHEEREILGFDPKTTYNRFCGDDESECEQPTHWKIVY